MAQIGQKGRILVTGATGFAGNALVPALITAGWSVRACGRDASRKPANCEFIATDLSRDADFDSLVAGTEAVVHLAARVHVMREQASDPLAEFRQANVAPTARLVAAAARNQLRHFIFASSIKVHGEESLDRPLREDDPLRADDPYGVSKIEAEQAVVEHSAGHSLTTSIFRLPLMYGPGVKGNFLRLARWVLRGVPLPLAALSNQRSMLYADNFSSAIIADLEQGQAGNRMFLLSDGHDISTADLVRAIATAVGRSPRLFPMPLSMLRLAATLAGYREEMRRLTESLQVDIGRIRQELRWDPPHSFDEGIARTMRALAPELARRTDS